MQRFRVIFVFAVLVLSNYFVSAGTLVQFRTALGDIEVELYDQDKPVTVQNFLSYVKGGYYQNGFAHRLQPGFVIQGGGYTLESNNVYYIPTFLPIVDEFSVGHQYSNVFGTIAMALGSNTNSATSQWFFNLADNSFLDNTNELFCVFGHVISGTNVLNEFNNFQNWVSWATNGPPPSSTNLVLNGYYSLPANTLPVFSSNYPPPLTTNNLVMFDISLMQIGIQAVGDGKQISWNSATGLTNLVEYTTNFTTWTTLATTNGTGARMTVTDTSPTPNRFYRVQVTY
jgi:peptidyl-prolyl cis-trans isomerase A (cyclophilin A)